MFFLPLPLVTDPFPLFKSISHSCTVPSSAVILKRKLPFIFFTIEPPSCQGKERESSRIYNRWIGLTVFILACTSSKKAEHFIVPPLVAVGAALLPLLLLQKYIINAAGKLKQ